MFNSNEELPSKKNGKYYQNTNAHVIDTYHLLNNNCTTKAINAINSLGSNFFQTTSYIPSFNEKGYNGQANKVFIAPISLSIYLHWK